MSKYQKNPTRTAGLYLHLIRFCNVDGMCVRMNPGIDSKGGPTKYYLCNQFTAAFKIVSFFFSLVFLFNNAVSEWKDF